MRVIELTPPRKEPYECDECRIKSTKLALFKNDYNYTEMRICKDCLKKALEMLE